jgi:hypothetical protein
VQISPTSYKQTKNKLPLRVSCAHAPTPKSSSAQSDLCQLEPAAPNGSASQILLFLRVLCSSVLGFAFVLRFLFLGFCLWGFAFVLGFSIFRSSDLPIFRFLNGPMTR